MANHSKTPLQIWQDDLADLAFACTSARRDQEAELLRGVHALLEQAPGSWARHFAGGLTLPALDVLIAAGGANAAALALVEGRGGYMLSHGSQSGHIATVVIDGMAKEASATGETAALAILGALAACLAGHAGDIDSGHLAGIASPSLRIN